MARYTVVWHPAAEDRLLDIWLQSLERTAVSDAANTIDRQLARNPEEKGEPRDYGYRELIVPPIRVLFEVIEMDRLVRVLAVQTA